MAQGQKYGYWQGNAGPVGPPPGFMEMATSGTRALARGIESASKSISDAIKQKDEEEKQINKLAKAGDTALSALNKLFPNENVYGEAGEEGYKNMGAEDRLAHYNGQNAALEMGNKLLTQRATTARIAASEQSVRTGQQQVASSQHAMDQDADTAAGVKSVFNQMSQPTQKEMAGQLGLGVFSENWQEPTMEQRKMNALSQAANANPNMDWAGAASALDRLLPEQKEQEHYGVPGTMTPILRPDGTPSGKSMYWQSSTGGTPLDDPKDTDGEMSIKTVTGEGGAEVEVVVDADGKVVPSATTALHKGSAEKNPFDELSSNGQQLVSSWVRSYWSAMKEKTDLEADMATNNLKKEDDVPATEGLWGWGGDSYEELHEKLDDKIAKMRDNLGSFRILPEDFNRTGQPLRQGNNLGAGISADAYRADMNRGR